MAQSKIHTNADGKHLSQGLFGGVDIAVESKSSPKPKPSGPPAKARRITLRREKSGRGGKVVTVVTDLPGGCNNAWRTAFLKRAKQRLGCGGTLQSETIELQGDCREQLAILLQEEGFRVVIAGG